MPIAPLQRPVLAVLAVVLAGARATLAVPAAYLTVLTLAAWAKTLVGARGPSHLASEPRTSFTVVVPAHDEELVIGTTLDALQALDYPSELHSVVVVADHCGDRTAEIAVAAGVTVHEHAGERGKGPALQSVTQQLLADSAGAPDAIVIIDADTVVDARLLRALDRAMRAGARAAQAHYGVLEPGESSSAALRAAALSVRHHLRPLGRNAIGASSGLYGNGMAFSSDLLRRRSWTGHLTEDLEFQMELLLDGVLVRYVPDARIEAVMPASLHAARTQNERWERGRLELARRYVPILARRAREPGVRQRVALVDGALDHLVPPLSVLVATTAAVTGTSVVIARLRGRSRRRSGDLLVASLIGHVLSGLALDRAPGHVYRSLLRAPMMVVWKVALWVRVARRDHPMAWVRTARAAADGPR